MGAVNGSHYLTAVVYNLVLFPKMNYELKFSSYLHKEEKKYFVENLADCLLSWKKGGRYPYYKFLDNKGNLFLFYFFI